MRALKKLHWKVAQPTDAEIGGVKLDTDSPQISPDLRRRIFLGNYEKEERAIVDALLQPDDRVLELGAGIGYLSTVCALKLGSERVAAVEANADMEPVIRRTHALNGVAPTLVLGSAGAEAGEVEFFFEPNFWSNSTVAGSAEATARKVRQLAIADLVAEHRPTVLICDIEGGEQALVPALPLAGLRAVIMELHPKRLGVQACSDIVRGFMDQGFALDVRNCVYGTVTLIRA